jgi:cytochrome c556
MMKRLLVTAVVLVGMGLAFLPVSRGEPAKADKPPDKEKLHGLMMRKLDCAQQLLSAVTKRDHKALKKNADMLVEITKDPAWKAIETEEFETLTADFRRNAELLAQNAKDENYDGAGLTYVSLTVSCLNCHKYMRDYK